MPIAMIVHGGAWDIPDAEVEAHRLGCEKALAEGWGVLTSGRSALEAVERAVMVLEDDPTFDAGTGSFLNRQGEVELDASIMEGKGLSAGAVAAVGAVRNPVLLARKVLERGEQVLLVGAGAARFAREVGVPLCQPEELVVPRERARWEALQRDAAFRPRDAFGKRGTVGAVALDRGGTVAAATSTGGSPNKYPGRVGDSPLIGSGTYADDAAGAASCTGWGEAIIKVVLAKSAVDLMRGGLTAREAARQAIALLHDRVAGVGGIILIDRAGRPGWAFNTPRMAYAYRAEGMEQAMMGI